MRISVALCTYNGARHLAAQLDSLAAQQRRPDELVVCDDASTDNTPAVVRGFAATAPFAVRIHRNDRTLGSTQNFAQAFALCTGDVIAPCDQDDCWLPAKLARVEQAFTAEPQLALAFSDGYLVDDSLEKTGDRIWPNLPFPPALQRRFDAGSGPRLLLRYNVVTGAAAAFRASLLPLLLPIPDCWVHDGWVGFLAAALGPARTLPEPLILYRRHAEQQIGVAPLTLPTQLAYARRMDLDYCTRQLDCFRALAERLEALRDGLPDPTLIDAVAEKVRFAEARVAMRRTSRAHRLLLAARELGAGRYHRCGRGVKGFVADALL
jgi:glycosyltransferase involved in cell wall biosynthesis